MPLTDDQILKLLNKEKLKTTGFPKPIQIGPMRYMEKDGRCASRGCSSPTHIQIEGTHYCSTHALYKLNQKLIALSGIGHHLTRPQWILENCNCSPGKHSFGQCHDASCPVVVDAAAIAS